jgi:2-C-methyl-D-erythritol 2,4-cyclodiphosphate synthase
MRIGFGYDVHKLAKSRKLILGGVEIPHEKGLLGWSDGDVLCHAIIDAILGAIGEGDIGRHFPPGDPRYRAISSLKMVDHVRKLLAGKGFGIAHIDSTIVAEEPKVAPYIAEMQSKIAAVLGISAHRINIKGKSEEGLGFTGKKYGIKAYAVCLIHKKL